MQVQQDTDELLPLQLDGREGPSCSLDEAQGQGEGQGHEGGTAGEVEEDGWMDLQPEEGEGEEVGSSAVEKVQHGRAAGEVPEEAPRARQLRTKKKQR